MNPADRYRVELSEFLYWKHYMNECDTWEFIVVYEEQNRIGCFIPKEI